MTSEDARALALEVRRLAHDLNNALMPILLASSTIRLTAAGDEKLARKIDAIEQSARRASSIVEEIQATVRRVAPPESDHP